MCTCNHYSNVTNFEWLITHVVLSLAKLPLIRAFEGKVCEILLDIATRLDELREKVITKKLIEEFFLSS